MNRKMRAKLANQQARATKEKRRCPQADKLIETAAQHCDTCGDELVPVATVMYDDIPSREEMH